MPRVTTARALVLGTLILGPIVGCNLSTEPLPDPSLCTHSSPENGGCARLLGVVLDSTGRPIEFTQLTLRVDSSRADPQAYGSTIVTTSTDGQFGLEMRRFAPLASAPTPDTITTRLIYGVPDPSSLNRLIIDSTTVLLHIQPPGSPAVIDTVTVRSTAR
jgi:hypothetical protein